MSERDQAWQIADRWLDFDWNPLTQMVHGDPDCDACVLARQFIRVCEELEAVKAKVSIGLSYAQTGGEKNDIGM